MVIRRHSDNLDKDILGNSPLPSSGPQGRAGNHRYRLPDFIIVGAMKAGTSSIHHIFNHHDNIFIPGPEIFFFDLDDPQQHPNFFIDNNGEWSFYDYEGSFKDYLGWYSSFFQDATDEQLIGEDSTTYMASRKVAPRIAKLLPDVKLIFMLRDPVSRAYSQYWHMVRNGYAIYDFESTLRHIPDTILQRGYYKEQIERFKQYFPINQLKFLIFEEFIQNTQVITDEVCEFLGLDTTIETSMINTHQHIGMAPRSLSLKLATNRMNKKSVERLYRGHIPASGIKKKPSTYGKFIEHLSPSIILGKIANLAPKSKYPLMSAGVRKFLEEFYAKENAGLGELIGIEIERYWPYMRHHSMGSGKT